MAQPTNKQIIADVEDYAKDITRLLVQIVCPDNSSQIPCEQAKTLTLDDFAEWQNTRLHKFRKVIENEAETKKPPKANKPNSLTR